MLKLLQDTIQYVLGTLVHNAPSLLLGILVAALIKVYMKPESLRTALMKKSNISIPGSVAFGAFTPFCACGTMAVVVSMLTTALPWGPIMAFLTSSPLMSPDQFILLSGIIGPGFAVALALSSIIIGLGSGYITHFIEKNTSFMDDQARFADSGASGSCGCSAAPQHSACSCIEPQSQDTSQTACCSAALCCTAPRPLASLRQSAERYKLRALGEALVDIGLRKVLLYFSVFAAIGYMINRFVPAELIMTLFSSGNIFAVPLSALIGLPLYVSGASSIPIVKALLAGGASSGAMLAFMITGPGTSAGAIAGIATIMKKKALALYILYLLLGAVLLGYGYDLLLSLAM